MTVAAGVLQEIVLVIVFCVVEDGKGGDFHTELGMFFCFLLDISLDDFPRGGVGIVDAGLVLGADVISLLVFHSGVYHIEEGLQKLGERYSLGIIPNPDGFPIAGISNTDPLVVRGDILISVGIAALCVGNAPDALKQPLCAPEAASGKVDF